LEEGKIEPGEWYLPARGPDAEEKSLRMQADRVKPVPPVDVRTLTAAIDRVVGKYPKTSLSMSQCTSDHNLKAAMSAVVLDSSPGYPFAVCFNTNAELLANPIAAEAVQKLALWRLRQLSAADPVEWEREMIRDPTWAIKNGFVDPMRLFVKDEPHSLKKFLEGRWRLINSLSITDQIVERMLYTTQDQAEISLWQHIPSKSGMGLDDASVATLLAYANANHLNLSTDVENWDFKAPDQIIRSDAEARILLNQAKDPEWERAVRAQYLLHSHRVLMLSNGKCFKRTILGGQASGRKVTSSSNGRCRNILEAIVALHLQYVPAAMTQGDDAVTRCPDWLHVDTLAKEYLDTFDIKLTDMVKRDAPILAINFCSQEMSRVGGEVRCVPEKPQKQLARFIAALKNPDRMQALESMKENLRHHRDRPVYLLAAEAALAT